MSDQNDTIKCNKPFEFYYDGDEARSIMDSVCEDWPPVTFQADIDVKVIVKMVTDDPKNPTWLLESYCGEKLSSIHKLDKSGQMWKQLV